jgi:polar amino acid transport system substrate-binding protein
MTRSRIRTCSALLLAVALAGCSGRPSGSSSEVSSANPPRLGAADGSLKRVQEAGVLRWGADVVGGVPYVYEDPAHPGQYVGFEKEIAEGVARDLGVKLELVVRAWDTLVPELQRGSFDMAMNGIEDTAERAKIVQFSDPYFVYSQQMTVRRDNAKAKSLADMRGLKVATLSGSAAEDILRASTGVEVVVSPEIIYSYRSLEEGKVDGVLLDTPIAAAYGATNPKLKNVGESIGEGRYVIAFRQEDVELKAAVSRAIERMKQDGTLKAIYTKYGIMDAHQARIGIQ